MTEEEWLACNEPKKMVEFTSGTAGIRKWRLFSCACCRRIWQLITDERWQRGVQIVESVVEGETSELVLPDLLNKAMPWNCRGANQAAASSMRAMPDGSLSVIGYIAEAVKDTRGEARAQSDLLREIFGNPFRLIAFSSAWRTDTVVTLAQQMYDSREFSAMPILADALQDVGCDNEDILTHCRDANRPHVRVLGGGSGVGKVRWSGCGSPQCAAQRIRVSVISPLSPDRVVYSPAYS